MTVLLLAGYLPATSVSAAPSTTPSATIAATATAPAMAPGTGPASSTTTINWNSTARLLAGLPVDSHAPLGTLAGRSSLREHQAAMDAVWQTFANRRLAPMRRFAQTELSPLSASQGPIYYPFSGPDALHALALFPAAQQFLLTGLEPVGRPPDLEPMDEASLRASLALLRRSISSVLSWSFFRTNDMKVDLKRNQLEGVTPILLAFTARYGFEVIGLDQLAIGTSPRAGGTAAANMAANAAGTTTGEAGATERITVPAVRLRFKVPGESAERSITYASADISNAGLVGRQDYIDWVKAAHPSATMLKSASYLLHRSSFSQVRSLILDQTTLVVQDDSGIPWQHFSSQAWSAHLYGHYTRPIALFANRAQGDLKAAYAGNSPSPLPFAYGYNYQDGGNNLQRFTRLAH